MVDLQRFGLYFLRSLTPADVSRGPTKENVKRDRKAVNVSMRDIE